MMGHFEEGRWVPAPPPPPPEPASLTIAIHADTVIVERQMAILSDGMYQIAATLRDMAEELASLRVVVDGAAGVPSCEVDGYA